jgi:hypothetical protein
MNLEFSQQSFGKYHNAKFYENPPCGSRAVPYGRTDRHDEANTVVVFRKFAKSSENANDKNNYNDSSMNYN